MSQLDFFGDAVPLEEITLRGHLAAIAREERELGARLTGDEAGALIHERQGKHDRDVRCPYCAEDGQAAIGRLRDRRGESSGHATPQETPSPPRARSTDPATSHAAARTVGDLSARHAAVLECFRTVGAMTDEALLFSYRLYKLEPEQSDSGLRTRRHELVDTGLLVDSGRRGKTEAGRASIIWTRAGQAKGQAA